MVAVTQAELALKIEGCEYALAVVELGAVYRLRKAGTKGWYTVELRPGGWACDCRGFLSYGRCRHVRSIVESGLSQG